MKALFVTTRCLAQGKVPHCSGIESLHYRSQPFRYIGRCPACAKSNFKM